MLDPDSVAEYEAWKLDKMTGSVDLSVRAFNAEMEALALAWEAGWRTGREGKLPITENPNRKPGMRGERVVAHIPPIGRPDYSGPAVPPHLEDPEEEDE